MLLPGYAETMDKLKNPKDWDVGGLILDLAEQSEDGPIQAVIDRLMFDLQEVGDLIDLETPASLEKALELCRRYTRGPSDETP